MALIWLYSGAEGAEEAEEVEKRVEHLERLGINSRGRKPSRPYSKNSDIALCAGV